MAHVLITNDDGYEAPGLAALYRAVAPHHRVSVVAPAGERSSTGHSATLRGAIRVRRLQLELFGEVWAVEGTPVDCVRLALAELVADPIDCVVAGINLGANVSVVDVHCSGTVAAAREAVFLGLPGIAFSQMYAGGQSVAWDTATELAAVLLPQLMEPVGASLWNVNFPALEAGRRPIGVRTSPLSCRPVPLAFERSEEIDGVRSFEYCGYYEGRTADSGTDLAALLEKYVSVTRLEVDATADSSAAAKLLLK